MKKDINKIAKEVTRKDFLDKYNSRFCAQCPSDYGLKENCHVYKNCFDCMAVATKDIKFLGDE